MLMLSYLVILNSIYLLFSVHRFGFCENHQYRYRSFVFYLSE